LRSILLLVFFNLAAAFALYFFIGCISKKVNPEFRFIGAVFYILNNYLLLYFGAYVTGWLLLSLPLLLGLLLKIIQSEPKQQRFFILLFGLAFFTTAPTSANPPTLFMLIGALLVFSLVSLFLLVPKQRRLAGALSLLKTFFITVLINSWWLFALFNLFRHLQSSPEAIAAVVDPAAWNWTFRNSSLVNILWFQSSWVWDAKSIGYFDFYQSGFIRFLTFVPMFFAFLPFVFSKYRRYLALFPVLVLLIGGIVLANRINSPLAGINEFLLENVPLMWLFREPVRFVGVVILAVATLLPFGLMALCDFFPRRRWVPLLLFFFVFTIIVFVSYPLWTGINVTGFNISENSNYRVKIPESIIKASEYINSGDHKYLSLPATANYQGSYSWGYHGIDPLVGMVTNPILRINHDAYLAGSATINSALARWYLSLENEISEPKIAELIGLGIDRIIWRNDLANSGENGNMIALKAILDSFPKQDFGEITVYDLPTDEISEISLANCVYTVADYDHVNLKSFQFQPFISLFDYTEIADTITSPGTIPSYRILPENFDCHNSSLCEFRDGFIEVNNQEPYSEANFSALLNIAVPDKYRIMISSQGEYSGTTKLTMRLNNESFSLDMINYNNSEKAAMFLGEIYLDPGEYNINFEITGGPYDLEIESLEAKGESQNQTTCFIDGLEYQKIRPTLYEMSLPQTSEPCLVVLDQPFHPDWEISVTEDDLEIEHLKINGYANAWLLNRCPGETATISYKPQKVFYYLVGISALTILLTFSYAFLNRKR
jgi:hypothetical protein